MSQFDSVIFGKKKFSDILEEIYNNQQKKDTREFATLFVKLVFMLKQVRMTT